MATTVFTNGRFFTGNGSGDDASFEECMVVQDDTIVHVGKATDAEVLQARGNGAAVQDLQMKYVLPGFLDGHMHLLLLGQALQKLDLDGCKDLAEIRERISLYAKQNPQLARIMCKGWMQPMTNNEALASMLDDLDARPIYIDSKDLHSTWCNTPALEELKVAEMPDPEGGTIHRDADGKPSGLLAESVVFSTIWPFLARVASMDEKLNALRSAIAAYTASGYTGLVDMAMDENAWEALLVLRQQQPHGKLALRIAAHWLIVPSADSEADVKQVERAIELHSKYNLDSSPDFRIAGIKVICDGVIDGCTAALLEPYTLNGVSCDSLWPAEKLAPVVSRAVKAGLQCALHAIGDKAVRMVLDVLEAHGSRDGRHRIEHLEMTTAEDAARLGKLGVTASVQPVHSDPDILRAWPSLIGPERCRRAFAYRDFVDGGATLAFGSDSPTAPFKPLPNLYIATTRRSARLPESDETVNPNFALPLVTAFTAATTGAAYACFADRITGRLKRGLKADFVVVDMEWSKERLLQAAVAETWFEGSQVFKL
jgi:predicted amidohydrolase YtcJ